MDLFVLAKQNQKSVIPRISHPLSVTLMHGERPSDAPGWESIIQKLADWGVLRLHVAKTEAFSRHDLHIIQTAAKRFGLHLVFSIGDNPAAPSIELPEGSRLHVPIAPESPLERLNFLGRHAAAGFRVRALTILDPAQPERLSELGNELAVRDIQEWTISPPTSSLEIHWLPASTNPEPTIILELKERFPWIRIEYHCFPIRENNLIVFPGGDIFTTDTITATHTFLGSLDEQWLAGMLAAPDFDFNAHLEHWLMPAAETTNSDTYDAKESRDLDNPSSARADSEPFSPKVPPEPTYPDERTRSRAQALERLYLQLEDLKSTGQDSETTWKELLRLRREMRDGGRLQAGDRLAYGRLKLLQELGHGGFATVWKAYDRRELSVVAVKVLHGSLAGDKSKRDRFFRGARRMAKLHHQGIVRVIEPGLEDDGYHFFVMEHIEGGDLRRAILRRAISAEAALNMLIRVGHALSFAHDQRVIHRDVKPDNILLDGDIPKLADFDTVHALDTTGGTRTRDILGTVLYTAPELLSNAGDVGVTADVYSLAMTAVFVLYMRDLPFAILRNDSLISELPCSIEMQGLLRRALSWNPRERPATVADFCRELESHLTARKVPSDQEGWSNSVTQATLHEISAELPQPLDAFASYDNEDWPEVKPLVLRLKKAGIGVWVDRWDLHPGDDWLKALETTMGEAAVMLAIIGRKGEVKSPYQGLELSSFLQAMKTRKRRLIPVILETAPRQVNLPAILKTFHAVDFRENDPDPFERLVWGITGKKPK